jgi:hypothetical protein
MYRNPGNKKESTAIFADTRTLTTFNVNATRIPGIGLVMRYSSEIGYLSEVMEKILESPLIISTRGHGDEATKFARIEGGATHREHVVGITGFPFQNKPEAFRALPSPMEVIIVPAGTRMEKIPTNNKHTATARAAFQAIKDRCGKNSAIIADGSNILVRGWEIFLPASNSNMPYFPVEPRKEIFSVQNMVNAALRLHAKRLDDDPVGGEGKHFLLLNQVLADEAVGDKSWKDKLLPGYTRILAGDNAENIVTRLAQGMREDGWSLTIDTDVKTLPLQAISPDGIVVASGPNLANIKGRTYWKEIVIELCDGLGFDIRPKLISRLGLTQPAEA